MSDFRDPPQPLLEIGTRMNDRLVLAIMQGYATGDTTEDEMILTIFDALVSQPVRQTAAQAMAGLFALAHQRKWDLVLVSDEGTRVVIPCDSEEEQTTRALEIMAAGKKEG